ncbi:unnamed protein product [Urochloa humidicola]
MDRCRAPAAAAAAAVKPDYGDADDDPDELGVFAAERYFYGDDALLWCGRSSSSLSASSAFRTTAGTLEHDRSVVPTPTAATSSSEASWNSRSALLPPPNEPPPPPPEKLRAGTVGGATATPFAAEPKPCGAQGISERAGRRRASSSSSNLRRWLIGVAGCACAGGDGEESASADEMEAGDGGVPGAGGERCTDDASKLSPRTEIFAEPAFEESAAAAATVRRGSGRWLLEGGRVLVERDAFSPIEIAGHSNRRGANSGELSVPAAVLHPAAATASADERRRVKSFEKLRPFGDDDQGISVLGPSAQNSSAFTIVAGGKAPRAAAGLGGGESPSGAEEEEDDDDAAAPPSEASVVWSVVTADGAASGNFSSAASGYYYYHYFGEGGASRRHDAAAARSDRRRRGGIAAATTGSLLACMSDKAVDAVGPVHRPELELGAAAGGRSDHGGGYHDVMRRRVT